MPPKKKGSKKGGKGKSKPTKIVGVPFTDMSLPPLPSVKNTAIAYTVASNNPETLHRLVNHYNYSDGFMAKDVNGSTAIHIAVKKGNPDMLATVLSMGRIDINAYESSDIGGYAAVHLACLEGDKEMLQILLNHGADPNIRANSSLGDTPLHVCCKHGQMECARILLDKDANPSLRDSFGHNASHWAVAKQHEDMIPKLGLPPAKAASANEFINILLANNKNFKLPAIKVKGKGKEKGKGKDGKKKKK